MKKYLGFTLLELVITIIILGIIAAMSSKPLLEGLEAYTTAQAAGTEDWQASTALDLMGREIRTIQTSAKITTATSTQFQFTDASGTTINYTLSGNLLMQNANKLVDNVTSLTFTYYNRTYTATTIITAIRFIQITLVFTRAGTPVTYQTTLNLPNLP